MKGLNEKEMEDLIRKRLIIAQKQELANQLSKFRERIKGIHVLTGGLPRLIHSLCEILIQQNSLDEMETNLLTLLDQLTPFYQTRMESMSPEKRKVSSAIASGSPKFPSSSKSDASGQSRAPAPKR